MTTREHEEQVSKFLQSNGFPPLTVTDQDRLQGAVISAMVEIDLGHPELARQTLVNALKHENNSTH